MSYSRCPRNPILTLLFIGNPCSIPKRAGPRFQQSPLQSGGGGLFEVEVPTRLDPVLLTGGVHSQRLTENADSSLLFCNRALNPGRKYQVNFVGTPDNGVLFLTREEIAEMRAGLVGYQQ